MEITKVKKGIVIKSNSKEELLKVKEERSIGEDIYAHEDHYVIKIENKRNAELAYFSIYKQLLRKEFHTLPIRIRTFGTQFFLTMEDEELFFELRRYLDIPRSIQWSNKFKCHASIITPEHAPLIRKFIKDGK